MFEGLLDAFADVLDANQICDRFLYGGEGEFRLGGSRFDFFTAVFTPKVRAAKQEENKNWESRSFHSSKVRIPSQLSISAIAVPWLGVVWLRSDLGLTLKRA